MAKNKISDAICENHIKPTVGKRNQGANAEHYVHRYEISCGIWEGNIETAVKEGNISKIKTIYEAYGLSFTAVGGVFKRNLLHCAAFCGKLDIVEHCVKSLGLKLDTLDSAGDTALILAYIEGHFKVSEYLRDQGANVNRGMYEDNISPGIWENKIVPAVQAGDLDRVRRIYEAYGLSYDAVGGDFKRNLLHYSALCGQLDIVEFCVKNMGLELDTEDSSGDTAWKLGAFEGQVEVCEYLRDQGAKLFMYGHKISPVIWRDKITPAVEKGNLNQIKDIYEVASLYYDAVGDFGWNLLHYAAFCGQHDIVKFCLKRPGLDIDTGNSLNDTALMLAAAEGHLEVVKCLIEQGADGEIRNKCSNTALICAASGGHLEVVEYLRKQGARVECQNKNGHTALMVTAGADQYTYNKLAMSRVVYYLLDLQDDMISEEFSEEILKAAAERGETEAVIYLVEEGLKEECRQAYKDASLVRTADRGYLDAVQFLECSEAHVGYRDSNGLTALGVALKNRNEEVAAYLCCLLDKTAEVGDFDLDTRYEDGLTVLMWATLSGQIDIVRYLIEQGANVNSIGVNGHTVLGIALEAMKSDIAAYLCSLSDGSVGVAVGGFDLEAMYENGYTVLMWAAFSGEIDIVRYLTKQGVNVNSRGMSGHTALGVALKERETEIAAYFCSLPDKRAEVGDFDLETKCEKGSTVLIWAVLSGDIDIVKYLTQMGANVNSRDADGHTALGIALNERKTDIAAHLCSLIDQRAEVGDFNFEARCENGQTVLMWAVVSGQTGIVKFLIEQGVNVNSRTEDYPTTALKAALERRNIGMIRYLTSVPHITVGSFAEFDELTSVLYGAWDIESEVEENELHSHLNGILGRLIDISSDISDDLSQICVLYRGKLYKSLVRLYLDMDNKKIRLDRSKLLGFVYIAFQAKQKCGDCLRESLKEGVGAKLYDRFSKEILKVVENCNDDIDHRFIAENIYAEFIEESRGCVDKIDSCLSLCWHNTKHGFELCCRCKLPEVYHKCQAFGAFARLFCVLGVVFYLLDLYTDIQVGYDDFIGFSARLGIFEMILVGFTWMHENIRSSLSQYSTETDILKVDLGKNNIEIADWKKSELNMGESRIKNLFFKAFWPFAIRKKSSCIMNFKAIVFNLLTFIQLRPVVDRLKVLLHSSTSLRAFCRRETEQNSLKQFYLITEQIPELMIQFYSIQIVFNLGNQQSNEQPVYSDCHSNKIFKYEKYNDDLNNTNTFCEMLSLSFNDNITCGILFRIFSLMMPFFMIPSGIVSLEEGFRALDPATPNMSTTVKCLLQAAYTFMIPSRVFMFATSMHSVSAESLCVHNCESFYRTRHQSL